MKKKISILSILLSIVSVGSVVAQIHEENVELRSDGFVLHGSLMLPAENKSNAVALLISHTNTSDRDGNEQIARNYALKKIAFNLAQNGIASLRYDKRGVGASQYYSTPERPISIFGSAMDVKNIVSALNHDSRFSKIIIIGHGEGSLLGLVALSHGAQADGFVSIEGVGRSFDQVLKDQLSSQPTQIRDIAYEIIDSLKAGRRYADVPLFLSSFFAHNLQPYLISSMRYNPQTLIRDLKLPTMIIHGDTDIKVKVEDARLLSAANPSSKLIVIAGMNHILKDCPSLDRRIQVPTYSNPALPVNATLLKELVKFINRID